jgi:hypothetical protein
MEVMELAGVASADARTRAVDLLDYLEVGHRKELGHQLPNVAFTAATIATGCGSAASSR